MDCIFCRIAAGEIPCCKVYEDELVLAFMDIAPLAACHTLVIPKQHFELTADCPAEVSAAIGAVLPKIAAAVQKAAGSTGINILNNNGTSAGQVVPHVHFHIIPRFDGDGVFTQWPAKEFPMSQIKETAAKIAALL